MQGQPEGLARFGAELLAQGAEDRVHAGPARVKSEMSPQVYCENGVEARAAVRSRHRVQLGHIPARPAGSSAGTRRAAASGRRGPRGRCPLAFGAALTAASAPPPAGRAPPRGAAGPRAVRSCLLVRRPLERPLQPPGHDLGREDPAGPVAGGAFAGHRLPERRPHPLPGHLDQAELRDGERLGAGAVAAEVGAQLLQHPVAVRLGSPCR